MAQKAAYFLLIKNVRFVDFSILNYDFFLNSHVYAEGTK